MAEHVYANPADRLPPTPLLAHAAASDLCVCGHTAEEHGRYLPAGCNHGHDPDLYCATIRKAIDEGDSPYGALMRVMKPDGCSCPGFQPAR